MWREFCGLKLLIKDFPQRIYKCLEFSGHLFCSFELCGQLQKKEWAHYFGNITGYFVISFYLLVNSLFLFVFPKFNVLDFGYASLQVYFDFAPWFLLLLIPAITMRSFADEQNIGTSELLYSLPLSTLDIVIGKFIGVFLILLIAISPTLIYAVALDQLSCTVS